MATMIEQVIKDAAGKQLRQEFPHLMLPGAVEAQVTKRAELSSYELKDMEIEGCRECGSFDATITGKWYQYNLKILTSAGAIDEEYPEIPGVNSKVQVEEGGKVAVALLYGELRPYILGEVK